MQSKYVLVTASSRGLGLEIAKLLSFAGYGIILTSSNKDNLLKAKSVLNQEMQHKIIEIDFTKDNIEEKLIKKIIGLELHSIVHNFGLKLEDDRHPIDTKILNKSIYNNFTISQEINNFLAKNLVGDSRTIIHIGSTASLHAKASPSYTLSKSLINTYVKNISGEYLKNNIMICSVLPGILAHEDSEWDKKKVTDAKRYDEVKRYQPLGRFAQPLDVASYVLDLVNQKSLMLSGSVLKLDANEY